MSVTHVTLVLRGQALASALKARSADQLDRNAFINRHFFHVNNNDLSLSNRTVPTPCVIPVNPDGLLWSISSFNLMQFNEILFIEQKVSPCTFPVEQLFIMLLTETHQERVPPYRAPWSCCTSGLSLVVDVQVAMQRTSLVSCSRRPTVST